VRRVALIVNPYASGVTVAGVDAVERTLRGAAEVERRQTAGPGHAAELAAEAAERTDAIVVYSGDGTYNEAVNGAAGKVPFGFIPGGGASVFPRAVGVGRDAASAAAAVAAALRDGRTRRISLGTVNGRRFLFAAGIGLDAEAVRRVEVRGRRPDGKRASNLVFGLVVARMLLERRLRVEPQLEVEQHGRAAFVLVANGRPYTYAGPLALTILGRAEFEGGLDFVALRALRPSIVPRLLLHMVRGTMADDALAIAGHDLDELAVRCDRPLPLQADGEDLGDVERVVFGAERGALEVLV
jgi:diacylglycerol kinase family enzyme